jgi:MFS family permease
MTPVLGMIADATGPRAVLLGAIALPALAAALTALLAHGDAATPEAEPA